MYYDFNSSTNLEVWKDGDKVILETEGDDNLLTVSLQKEDIGDLIDYLTKLYEEL